MFKDIISNQRNYFNNNQTKDVNFRINTLKKLKSILIENEELIFNALQHDLNKSNFESYATEISLIHDELNYMIKNIKKLSKNHKVKTPIHHFHSKSFYKYEAYGVVLIISAWNYPLQLALIPLIGAIASGNTVILKTSENAPECEKVLEIILNNFDKNYICLIKGSDEVNKSIIKEKFDYIFFTGSTKVGKIVYQEASNNLTPVTLELGGKSPVIIDETAKIELACKRIIFGKLINSGQTCVAPDYLLVKKEIKDEVIKNLIKYIKQFYNDALNNNEYPKIVNVAHYERLINLINNSKVIYGGEYTKQKIAPCLVESEYSDLIMKDEIFGPILPILTYDNLDKLINEMKSLDKPLALYIFSNNKNNINNILNNLSYGGGCINDTLIHLANPNLDFGGVGSSGIGSYHAKASYTTFSHKKSILKRSNFIDINIRYAPFKNKIKILKKILK